MSGPLHDLVSLAQFRVGRLLAAILPERAAYAFADWLGERSFRAGGRDVARLRANYAAARPELDPEALDEVVCEGFRRNVRYFYELFRLTSLSRRQVSDRVRVAGDAVTIRAELAAGRPVVCFLGHTGNWDLAGAWCGQELGPVVTVAERVKPAAIFEDFLRVRTGLGMRIIALDRPDVMAALRAEMRAPVVVPLLADRDLTGGGVAVSFFGRPARMAVGPAALALSESARLIPISIRHERRGRGYGIVITFHDPVPVPPTGTAREKAVAMTQACADALAGEIVRHTSDWHMFQRVFADDTLAEA